MTAIDVDEDIVDQARDQLATAGVDNVEVVLGDGALGHQPGAPYDRIIATVGAYGIPDTLAHAARTDGQAGRAYADLRKRVPLDRLRAR